ncbi:hypothetical protein [Mesorhizobium sp.]|uniref:hypothetical protein n=1 Tax=Mesorhizobium sp. TaxID=1871066 RepID=UPI00120637EB|nr:hypothetical protein [Mesorhizobium sp.]TIQ44614.1 MAG: hypothetical protein E5X47_28155 [Mesorhizobium sp.]TIQ54348.1 MAG: hypothetical protein E5X46_27600 [Mesorhizobium sp.]
MMRMVGEQEWVLSEAISVARARRLLNPLTAEDLLASILAEIDRAVRDRNFELDWETACERPGFWRFTAKFPVAEATFDQLFNGRSGYRAQYYLSPEEGLLFNRKIIESLEDTIHRASSVKPISVGFDLIVHSLRMAHAKIWIADERAAFDDAVLGGLQPQRWWSATGARRGCRAPLPVSPKIDLKGSFIDPETGSFWVDPLKERRAWDLYEKGFS